MKPSITSSIPSSSQLLSELSSGSKLGVKINENYENIKKTLTTPITWSCPTRTTANRTILMDVQPNEEMLEVIRHQSLEPNSYQQGLTDKIPLPKPKMCMELL